MSILDALRALKAPLQCRDEDVLSNGKGRSVFLLKS